MGRLFNIHSVTNSSQSIDNFKEQKTQWHWRTWDNYNAPPATTTNKDKGRQKHSMNV